MLTKLSRFWCSCRGTQKVTRLIRNRRSPIADFVEFFEHQVAGRSLSELSTVDWSELDRDFELYAEWMGTMLTALAAAKVIQPTRGF